MIISSTTSRLNKILVFHIVSIIALLPASRFLWDPWSVHWVLMVVLSAWFFYTHAYYSENIIPHLNISLTLIIFVSSFLISASHSNLTESNRTETLNLFNALSLFILVGSLDPRRKFFLEKCLCLSVSVVSFFFIFLHFYPITDFSPDEFFLKPNFVSSLSILGLLSAFGFYKEMRFFSIVFITINAGSFILAKSVAGLIGLGIAFEILYSNYQKKYLFLLGTACLAVIFVFFFHNWELKSIQDRLNWWSAAFQMIINHPFFGTGPGTFESASVPYFEGGLKSLFAHNFILHAASEWGIAAVLSFLIFIVTIFKRAGKNYIKAALLAILFQNCFDYSLNVRGFFLLFFVCLALMSENGEHPMNRASSPLWRPVLLILQLLIMVPAWQWGVKPLVAFQKTSNAYDAFKNKNLIDAERYLRGAIRWDAIPVEPYSHLSKDLFLQYKADPNKQSLLIDAIRFQREALSRNPTSTSNMEELRFLTRTH